MKLVYFNFCSSPPSLPLAIFLVTRSPAEDLKLTYTFPDGRLSLLPYAKGLTVVTVIVSEYGNRFAIA